MNSRCLFKKALQTSGSCCLSPKIDLQECGREAGGIQQLGTPVPVSKSSRHNCTKQATFVYSLGAELGYLLTSGSLTPTESQDNLIK